MPTLFKSYQQDGYNFKKEEIEGAILKRILSLFHIACRNWPVSSLLSTRGIGSIFSTSDYQPTTCDGNHCSAELGIMLQCSVGLEDKRP